MPKNNEIGVRVNNSSPNTALAHETSGEVWKDIPGYEGLYQVSNIGNVKSLSRIVRANTCGVRTIPEKVLTPCKGSTGYLIVVLCKNGKHKSINIHRLVAISFIPNPDNLKEVNHRNEIKTDNMVSNLEWCDRKYNANYGTGVARQKISRANNPNDRQARLIVGKKNSKRVKQIANNGDILNIFDSMRQASVATGVCLSTVLRHCKGIISFSTLGFSFKYV